MNTPMTDDQIVYALKPPHEYWCSDEENEAFFAGARAALAASPSMDALATEIYEWAHDKGFYERESIAYGTGDIRGTVPNPSFPSEKVALIMSEGAEVLEALRNDDREEEAAECADIIIRVLDYAAFRGFSMNAEIAAKMEKNRERPYKHGKKF
jgi:NTP pyrophosphatase (non-canonical NTP hydrolase)